MYNSILSESMHNVSFKPGIVQMSKSVHHLVSPCYTFLQNKAKIK